MLNTSTSAGFGAPCSLACAHHENGLIERPRDHKKGEAQGRAKDGLGGDGRQEGLHAQEGVLNRLDSHLMRLDFAVAIAVDEDARLHLELLAEGHHDLDKHCQRCEAPQHEEDHRARRVHSVRVVEILFDAVEVVAKVGVDVPAAAGEGEV